MRNNSSEGAAISIRALHVIRGGNEVLPRIDLDVPRGQIVGLLGPSGGGKTTLMRAIVGAQIVAGGSVEVLGHPAGSPVLRSRIGYVTQAPSIYPDLTARENLSYFAKTMGEGADAVAKTLHHIGLSDAADRPVSTLSGGQKSRVSLGAALVGDPELLVLDEPTVGLDPALRRDLWGLFHELRDAGKTLLVSSHVMDEAIRCDRLVFVRDGAILADDTLEAILADTGTDNADAAFLALTERNAA
ncbi:ABC transporter ATP-binding protein [Demequina sp. TTPB684]|uniref:ABC transporter ATP-binding protein n=1 Tax=unclassified Demequina TaxID=2620311 RepID=UPI001CF4B7D0|nr:MULTISPECIES: ABC transporter ATP-binding protein [unclassified Demequina]MCB2413241.1 ABC transporter ATP-binding protein [Demequina sp. TTPB684]UPU88185.1 ABC transporter ATP-binding protein [Demequina sp. TMPB413]